jgi:hypothetical protein
MRLVDHLRIDGLDEPVLETLVTLDGLADSTGPVRRRSPLRDAGQPAVTPLEPLVQALLEQVPSTRKVWDLTGLPHHVG